MIMRNLSVLKRFYVEVKNMTEFENATRGKDAYVVQFTAAWCGPCKQLAPVLISKQEKSEDAWNIIKVDVDE